jgi:preprotein translocase subunit SecG
MTSILFIVQIVLAILITIVVLLQKSSSIGLGAYSGSNESLFGAKGPAGFLAKLTFSLGLLFVINTLALGYLYSKDSKKSVTDELTKVVPASKEAPKAPAAPAVAVKKEANNTKALKETNSLKAENNNSNKTAQTKDTNSSK